jgi:hypothetical protein
MHNETLPHDCTVTEIADGVFLLKIPTRIFPVDERWRVGSIVRYTLYRACHDGKTPEFIRSTEVTCELHLESRDKVRALMEQLTLYLEP